MPEYVTGVTTVRRTGDDLLDTGVHSVLRVVEGDVERLIPFVAAYVDDVSLDQRKITVDWGLDF